ncbi:MAG: tRNA preQ1(34) S-adenosylmethionine ribosyltransferase-isomerase QueA [Pseudomonadota bacterium]
MRTADFDFDLPGELIAQIPLSRRSDSRLLVCDAQAGSIVDSQFAALYEQMCDGDLLVLNDTRVIPARVEAVKKTTGGRVEILVERVRDDQNMLCHVRASKSPKPGTVLSVGDEIDIEVTGREADLFCLQLISGAANLDDLLNTHGAMPLPPYIEREANETDDERYQTVYAQTPGAVAAPTAGLHFDDDVLHKLSEAGVETAFVTLHVGAGTFQPVRVEDPLDHTMHSEWINVDQTVCDKITQTRARGGRVIAVGTTVVRSLESAAAGGELEPFSGDTSIFITPGYRFRCIDALITNFHLPKSTLMMLVSAFGGREFMLRAYQHAIDARYRFFSYGDSMMIFPDRAGANV